MSGELLTYRTHFLFIVVLLSSNTYLLCQDLSNFKNQEAITLTGRLQTRLSYQTPSIYHFPLNYYLNGNLDITLYGVSIPLSLSYSNNKTSYAHPFNRYGLSPTYKDYSLHLGYRNMNFSPYSLNGHDYLGSGFSILKEHWSIETFYGRLNQFQHTDSLNQELVSYNYNRLAYGIKATIKKESNLFAVSIFKARDQNTAAANIDRLSLAENCILTSNYKKVFSNRISLSGEWASNAYNPNYRSSTGSDISKNIFTIIGLQQESISSQYSNAFHQQIDYIGNAYQVGLKFEHIDPDYTSLGSYYFNNDLENITLNYSSTFLQKKCNLHANFGKQRNNLDKKRIATNTRWVGSGNLSYRPNPNWFLASYYSNFTTHTLQSPLYNYYDTYDTLSLAHRQISQSSGVNINHQKKEGNFQNSISFNLGNQQAISQDSESKLVTTFLSFRKQNLSTKSSYASNINYSRNEYQTYTDHIISPSVSLGKSFFEQQIPINIQAAYNLMYRDNLISQKVFSIRIRAKYSLKENHVLQGNISIQKRNTDLCQSNISIHYNYQFK